MKCLKCDHVKIVNEKLITCPYSRCVKEDGWIADEKRKAKETTSHVDRERMDKGLPVWREDKLPEQDMSVL